MRIQKVVRTKITNDHEAIKTDLTLDFSEISKEDLVPWATKSVIIAEQRVWRESEVVPEKLELVVKPIPVKKKRVAKIDVDRLSDEQALILMEKLQKKLTPTTDGSHEE